MNQATDTAPQTYDARPQQDRGEQALPPAGVPIAEQVSQYHKVQIQKVANGFTIFIGCKTFVARTWKEASEGIAEYWKDPVAAEKKYVDS